jgi:hypothetical protein
MRRVQTVVGEYIEAGVRDPDVTPQILIDVLDLNEIVAALERR